MNLRAMLKIGAAGLAMIPVIGATCTDEKVIDIIIGADIRAEFLAEGELNTHQDSDMVNIKEEFDIEGALDDAGVDANDLDPDALKVSRIYYRVTVPEAGRSIANGTLTVQRGGGTAEILVTGFSASVATATDWIEITNLLGASGVSLLNDVAADCIVELQGGAPLADPVITYEVTGDSLPGDVETNFQWAVKVEFQGKLQQEFEVPDF